MSNRNKLDDERNMEVDCTLGGGGGFGKYTYEVSQLRSGIRISRAQFPCVILDSDPTELGPIRRQLDVPDIMIEIHEITEK